MPPLQTPSPATLSPTVVSNVSQSTSVSAPTANLLTNESPESSSSDNRKIAWIVIGVVGFLSLSIALAAAFKLWRHHRRPKSFAPSAAYRHRYAPIDAHTFNGTSLGKDAVPDIVIDIRPVSPAHNVSESPVSLSFTYETPELSSYSPAVESSGVFSHGGHESVAVSDSDTVSLSHFARLAPQRRAGGRM
ncbi:hypothetical protein R3P38DRAFT_2969561 [Favolaschia claudopus]|uniref:Uncharacterized protein n=1 Tax=Favolaschia claudopus TaxID=2862362 RepID=A0AAW0B423_9AGAR